MLRSPSPSEAAPKSGAFAPRMASMLRVISSIFAFGETTVREVMVSRVDMIALSDAA